MNDLDSSSVCFELNNGMNQEKDADSELTGSCYGDEYLSHSHSDKSGTKLAADLYYLERTQERQEFMAQITRQQEKIKILSSKLRHYVVENEILKAQKKVLLDELAHPARDRPDTRRSWFANGCDTNGGSMQMLIDANSKLRADNDRIQVIVDMTNKSFENYIEESRRKCEKDKMAIETLQGEKELEELCMGVTKSFELSLSEITSKTSLASSFKTSAESSFAEKNKDDPSKDGMWKKSLNSVPDQFKFGISGDDWDIEGEDIEGSHNSRHQVRRSRRASMTSPNHGFKSRFTKGAAHSKSEALLVNFGETETSRLKLRNYSSEELLVDFGETRQSKTKARRWSSLKLQQPTSHCQ